MSNPSVRRGGDSLDIIKDVKFAPGLVTPGVAYHASRTALRLFNALGKETFVTESGERVNGSRSSFIDVGWWKPEDYPTTPSDEYDRTLWAQSPRARSRSFVTAVEALMGFCNVDSATYVRVGVLPDRSKFPYHFDSWEGSLAIMTLAGLKQTSFVHSETPMAETTLLLQPGDAYRMHFTDGGSNLLHAAEHTGETNVSLFIYDK